MTVVTFMLWTDAVQTAGSQVHHRDVVTMALKTLEHELTGPRRQETLDRFKTGK